MLLPGADRQADVPVRKKPADQYANKQKADGITIAAESFLPQTIRQKMPFGKLNLSAVPHSSRAGRNPQRQPGRDSPGKTALRNMSCRTASKVRLNPCRRCEAPIPKALRKPKVGIGPLGGVKVAPGKSPLNVPEIEIRAFSAKMLPPGETASGFVYFETDITSARRFACISPACRMRSGGKDIYYFEIPLSGK